MSHYKGAILYRDVHVMAGTNIHRMLTERNNLAEARGLLEQALAKERMNYNLTTSAQTADYLKSILAKEKAGRLLDGEKREERVYHTDPTVAHHEQEVIFAKDANGNLSPVISIQRISPTTTKKE